MNNLKSYYICNEYDYYPNPKKYEIDQADLDFIKNHFSHKFFSYNPY